MTREAILHAALELFAERGYEGATLRAITAKAGVDVAMVSHFFGDKQGLFDEAVQSQAAVSLSILSGFDSDRTPAAQVLDSYLSVWENPGTALTVRALFRAALESDEHRQRLQEMIGSRIIETIGSMAGRAGNPGDGALRAGTLSTDATLRMQLLAAHLLGVGIARYILKFTPIANTPRDELIADLEPIVAAYLQMLRPAPDSGRDIEVSR